MISFLGNILKREFVMWKHMLINIFPEKLAICRSVRYLGE